jgi:lysophospholipase L1-like esterase
LAKAYETLRQSQNLQYICSARRFEIPNNEGTVDGTHLNDLGFVRFAERLLPTIRKHEQPLIYADYFR